MMGAYRFVTKIAETSEERQAAKAVWRLCFPSDPWAKPDVMFVTWDREMGCYCAMSAVQYWDERDEAFLQWVGVLPYCRRMGLHKKHIEKRRKAIKEYGAKYMVSYTIPGNTASSRNLEASGFKSHTPTDPYYENVDWWRKAVR